MSGPGNTPHDADIPIEDLASRVCDETISGDERDRLEGLLSASKEHRRRYLRYMMVNAALAWRYRTGARGINQEGGSAVGSRPESRRPRRERGESSSTWGLLLGSLAVCASIAFVGVAWWIGRDEVPARQVVPARSGDFVATLREASGGIRTIDRSPIEVGARVRAGGISLDGGEAEFVFDSGVRLVVQGPAELSLKNADAAFLRTGKAVVFVPERAIGFQLATPTSLLIDQGTEFGVVAEETGATEVHVFKGQVDVVAAAGSNGDGSSESRVAVLDREARRVEDAGTTGSDVAFSPKRFGGLVSRVGEPLLWSVEEGGNGHYYQIVVHGQPLTWHAAALDAFQRYHSGLPGHLVSVTSAKEHEFLVDKLLGDATAARAWIGLTDVLREGNFRWVTGEPVEYEAWATEPIPQPDNFHEWPGHGGEDYAIYAKSAGYPWRWNDLSNDSMHETVSVSIVEFEPPLDATKQRSMAFEPIEWRKSDGGNGHYYRLVLALEPSDWETVRDRAAQTTLNGKPGALTSLETDAEQEFVVNHVLRVCGIRANMIGFCGELGAGASSRWLSGADVDANGFRGRLLPGQRAYGELRWMGKHWERRAVADDVMPPGWFGYIVEHDAIAD
jgi:hypothetical protein